MEFKEIVLEPKEVKALKLLSKQDYARSAFPYDTDRLKRLGFVYYGTINTDPDDPYQYEPGVAITDSGVDYLRFDSQIKANLRTVRIRYWITTSIAILALMLSIVSLLSQLGLLQLPQFPPKQ